MLVIEALSNGSAATFGKYSRKSLRFFKNANVDKNAENDQMFVQFGNYHYLVDPIKLL